MAAMKPESRGKMVTAIVSLSITVAVLIATLAFNYAGQAAQVDKNKVDIEGIKVDIKEIKQSKQDIDELKYNLRNYMESQGVKYQQLDN